MNLTATSSPVALFFISLATPKLPEPMSLIYVGGEREEDGEITKRAEVGPRPPAAPAARRPSPAGPPHLRSFQRAAPLGTPTLPHTPTLLHARTVRTISNWSLVKSMAAGLQRGKEEESKGRKQTSKRPLSLARRPFFGVV
jgi:hypothetical protein